MASVSAPTARSSRRATKRLSLLICIFACVGLDPRICSSAERIPQSGWTLQFVDSQETVGEDGRAVNAFDGDPATLWHTSWLDSSPPHPHEIQIDLGDGYDISGFRYLPRTDGVNGTIVQYQFYISNDGENWGSAVATGSFAANQAEKEVILATPVTGHYIRLVALSAVNGKPWTSAAEFNVLGNLSTGSQAPNGTIETPAGNLTLTVGDTVDFTASASDPDNNTPLTYQWSFGDPAIPDAFSEDPGAVQFNTPGTYSVSFTVTDALGLADPTPATRTVTVNAAASDVIPQSGWTLQFVDSQETVGEDGRAVNAFDGDPATLWHTSWLDSSPPHPHEIQIDLGDGYDISGFRYLPRTDGVNGTIVQYQFYISNDGENWGSAVATGSFAANQAEKEVILATPVTGHYIRLVALSAVNGKPWTSAAEFNVLGNLSTGSQAPNGTIETPAGNLTLTVGDTVDFTASASDPDNNTPLTYQWSFGDPAIPDAFSEDPGAVQFNTPGTYSVSFTVTDALGLADPTPATRTVTVNAAASDVIPQSGWTLQFVDSQETVGEDGRAVNAFDGDPYTLWHTAYATGVETHPHEIVIDLGDVYSVTAFRVLPRYDGGINGRIAQYAFYVGDSPVSWETPVASGTFVNDPTEKEIAFTPVTGRYVRLVALSEINGSAFSSLAELNVLGNATANYAPNGTIDSPAFNLTITTGDSVNFRASAADPDIDTPFTHQWAFGDPAIPDAFSEDPGTVQFNTPGTYTVTYTVGDNLGLADPTPATRVVKVLAVGEDPQIPTDGWSIAFVDSEETAAEDGVAANALDGDPTTIWHSEWSLREPPPAHELQVNLGAMYLIDGLRQLPRQDGSNGRIRDYHIYVSADGHEWGAPVARGTWANSPAEQSILFPPTLGQFVKLVALSEVNGNPWASIAELSVEGRPCSPKAPFMQLQLPDGYLQADTTVTVPASVCFDPASHSGWAVRYVLDGGAQVVTDTSAPYVATFTGLAQAEHTITASIVDEAGTEVVGPLTQDSAIAIGLGSYYVAAGDSITAGVGDDIKSDDISTDGRDREGGYTPLLNNKLTATTRLPHKVAMEGVPGVTSPGYLARLPRIINRHPNASTYLVLLGTNDASIPLPSGQGLSAGQAGFAGSFKDNMQQIIDLLAASGKHVYLAKIPWANAGATLDATIQEYNSVIDELVTVNGIGATPPDFYHYFLGNPIELSDTLHPNGTGYDSMGSLWQSTLR